MPLPKNIENEAKFAIHDPAAFRKMLRRQGARVYPAVKEADYFFDVPRKLLAKQDKLLRLRKSPGGAIVTYKGPMRQSRFKKREEINIRVADFRQAWDLFEHVGFKGRLLKEKVRQRFVWRKIPLFLDRLPFLGYYLEIEGSDARIVRTAKSLGLDIRRAITTNYNRLFNAFCAAHRKDFPGGGCPEFSFRSEKRAQQ